MPPATGDGGERLTVHQLLRRSAPAYLERFGSSLPGRQRQVLKKILACRTPALGGQLFQCPECPGFHYQYHSCNDRHCPQCGQSDADAWLERQRARLLLPVPYFLVTFTVPEELRRFLRSHPQIGLDRLFAASAQALQDLALNPKRLGAQLGMLGVLHTWSRTLIFHPHVHYLIPGGGLSADGRRWVPAKKFLLHHTALGDRCRTLFKERLRKEHPELFAQVPAQVWKRHWNVGAQAAGSGENALRYLARYVFKTATSNRPVTLRPDGKVCWPYRDSQTRRDTSIVLEPREWVRRFLQHILPRHFARVRTFGWLHPAAKVRGNRVRALLRETPLLTNAEQQTWKPPADPEDAVPDGEAPPPVTPPATRTHSPLLCPRCQQAMRRVGSWHAGQPMLLPNRPP
ncbi:MAG: IS91 family transposase [Methyloceanibacter sp.]